MDKDVSLMYNLRASAKQVLWPCAIALVCWCTSWGAGPIQDKTVAELKADAVELDRTLKAEDYNGASASASKIWHLVQQSNITSQDYPELSTLLSKVAGLMIRRDTPMAVQVLKGILNLPDSHVPPRNHKITPFEWAAERLGETYLDAGCQRSAIKYFREALAAAKSRTDVPPALNHNFLLETQRKLGEAYYFNHNPADEFASYQAALTLIGPNPQSIVDLETVGFVLLCEIRNGMFDSVKRLLARFLAQYPVSNKQQLLYKLNLCLLTATEYMGKNKYEEADAVAAEGLNALQAFPDTASDRNVFADLRSGLEALRAVILLKTGHYDEALHSLQGIYGTLKLNQAFSSETAIESMTPLADLARLYVKTGDFEKAFTAYILLVRHYGQKAADFRNAATARQRLVWINQQNFLVQELTSVWLSLPKSMVKEAWEPEVANALLQVKATLFLAIQGDRAEVYRNFERFDTVLFAANRHYAQSAWKVWNSPSNDESWAGLEDDYLRREFIESRMHGAVLDSIPALSSVYSFDFRNLSLIKYGDSSGLISYSLVDLSSVQNGQLQPPSKRILVGVEIVKDRVRVVALGEDDTLVAQVRPFLDEVANRPRLGDTSASKAVEAGKRAYDLLLAPFEPLPANLYMSPEGVVSNVPFAALVEHGRFLVEQHSVWISHSLLNKEDLWRRQHNSNVAAMYADRPVVLMGNPSYGGTPLPSLAGTKVELESISRSLAAQPLENPHFTLHTRSDANVQTLLSLPHPYLLHIAAHGEFWPGERLLQPTNIPPFTYWRSNPELIEGPLGGLDESLLRSALILSVDPKAPSSPDASRRVTALELSSLNLLGCHLLALSACDTGLGTLSRGAGVLGFQYAAQATMAANILLSLWNISDDASSRTMSAIYNNWLVRKQSIPEAYTTALRGLCRTPQGPVHPYYWAPFILINQDY